MTTYVCTLWVSQNISISMYIMCVILCLFSTLSCRVGALQISIIIIGQMEMISIWPGLHPLHRRSGGGVPYKQQGFFPSKLCMLHAYNYKSDADYKMGIIDEV